MPKIKLSEEAREALSDGKTVKIKHASLGEPGYNGRLTIHPPDTDDLYVFEADVVSIDDT